MLKKLLPAMLAVACCCPASASPWAFDQILQSALQSHPQVLGKQSALMAALQEREGAQWQRWPTASMEASSQGGGAGLLRLEQPLWAGGRIQAGMDAADSRALAARWTVQEARQDLALKVVAASTEALRQQARQAHSQQGLGEHERLLAMMQRRVAQEVSPAADERMAQARLYAVANDVSSATQALNNALTQLSQLAGESVESMDSLSLRDRKSVV